MTEKILITGATGFVGDHVARHLLASGHSLTLLVRNKSKVADILARSNIVNVIEADDIITAAKQRGIWAGVTDVVHIAGLAHQPKGATSEEKAFMEANFELTRVLADQAAKQGARRFVFVSSLAAITPNASDVIIDDDTDMTADTPYGRSKREAEVYLETALSSKSMAVSLRPPLVVGAEARGNWRLLQKLAATGLPLPFRSVNSKRSYIGIHSLTEAIAQVLATEPNPSLSGQYCLCDRDMLNLSDLLYELKTGMGKKPLLFPFPPRLLEFSGKAIGRGAQVAGLLGNLAVNPDRFFDRFAFTPSTGIREAIRRSGREFVEGSPK